MNTELPSIDVPASGSEPSAPACVLTFNVNDPSGAGGLAGDVATIAAMGAHPLSVVTSILMRDTAEIFDHLPIDEEAVVEQARTILEDVSISGWKVGFLGSADTVAAVAEVLSDYTEVPLVAYMPDLSWLEEDQLQPYLEAYRELILPAAEILVGNRKTLSDLLLPDWDNERPLRRASWQWLQASAAPATSWSPASCCPPRAHNSKLTTCSPPRRARWREKSSTALRCLLSEPATPCRPLWLHCWPPALNCKPRWVRP